MRRKKFLPLILLIGVGLTACHGTLLVSQSGGGNEAPLFEVPDNFDESRQYNLTFWSKNDTNQAQRNIYLQAIDDFEALYPNININISSYTNYTDIYRDVLKNISTNTTPNICIAYPDHVATYKTGYGMVVELDSLMSDSKYGFGGSELKFDAPTKKEVVSKYLNEGILPDSRVSNGYLYFTLPYMRSDEVMYVNKDYLVENGFEIPKVFTWDYVWEVCEYARKKYDAENQNNPGYKNSNFIPLIYKSTDNMFIQMCKQYGYDYTNENGDILFDNPQTRAMLKNLWNYTFKDRGLFDVFARVSYPGNKFNRKECIFAIDSSAGATWMGSDAPLTEVEASSSFETLVTDIPQDNVNGVDVISQGPSICLFNKSDPQEVLASWLFAQYLLTNKVQINYAKTEGYSPVTYKAINSSEFQGYLADPSPIHKAHATTESDYNEKYYVKIAATKNVIQNIENSFTTPAFRGSSLVRSAVGDMIFWLGGYNTMTDADIEAIFARAKKNCMI